MSAKNTEKTLLINFQNEIIFLNYLIKYANFNFNINCFKNFDVLR